METALAFIVIALVVYIVYRESCSTAQERESRRQAREEKQRQAAQRKG